MKQKKIIKLEGLEKITAFLKVVFASGYVKGINPLSCLIVAPISNGKTTCVKQFINKNEQILINTDLTAWGALKEYEKELRNGDIKHIVIPDLLNILNRKKQVADQMVG